MDWYGDAGMGVARLVVSRGLALVYVIAFLVAIRQWPALLGDRGLLPVRRHLQRTTCKRSPSLLRMRCGDRWVIGASVVGALIGAAIVAGLVERAPIPVWIAAWLAMWATYLSLVNAGQVFYGFGWETLLCEAGFLATFLGPRSVAPPVVVLWLFRWLAFRVELGAGLIKLRGDACWRSLTCTRYHHETQPLPNPLSWRFHHLPDWMHRAEVLGNHAAQLVAPWLLFLPQPVAGIGAVVMIVTQCWLLLSGNFSWLNLVTIVIVAAALPGHAGGSTTSPSWWVVLGLAASALIVVLSIRPALNLVSRRQLMNSSFDPLRLVNTYGAFGHVTKHRDELIIEGTHDALTTPSTQWQPYEFKAKPGDPHRRPRQVAPYHLRLDWLMWFAALGSPAPWLDTLVDRLLHGDAATLRLLGANPFPDEPPAQIRVVTYRYRFTTKDERTQTGDWWHRQLVGTYLPARRLDYRRRT
jgi:hypothetical protein